MSVLLSEVTTVGGPLPEGNLCAYSYDPVTSSVYLTRLIDETTTSVVTAYFAPGETNKYISYTGSLQAGTIQLEFSAERIGNVGLITITNDMGQQLNSTLNLVSNNTFDATVIGSNLFAFRLLDPGTYTIRIDAVTDNALQLIRLELPTSIGGYTNYTGAFDQVPSLNNINTLLTHEVQISDYRPLNTSWGYVRKNNRHLAVQTIAPFPPTFYDRDWYDLVDYVETTSYTKNFVSYKAQSLLGSETQTSIPDLSKAVIILTDSHARSKPNCYDIAIITQELSDRQLLWRCFKEQRVITDTGVNYTISINIWKPSENVYKYKSGSIYFGGKNYSGPLNSIMYDGRDGVTYSEHAILDLNEFPINTNNEVFVYDHISNYSSTAPKVYCVLNKLSGRMAEIDVNSKTVKYFTLVVPVDHELQKLYYTNRLMYTVKKLDNSSLSLYDANNNGVLLYPFDLGSYDPSVQPQFSIIN